MTAVNLPLISLVAALEKEGIEDSATLEAMRSIDRKLFIDRPFADRAYDNVALPIASGQTISQPIIVGMMTQALELSDRHRVLEIGTGSGYQTAILSCLARRVYTIERHGGLSRAAHKNLAAGGVGRNVTMVIGDGCCGLPDAAPFDRIIVTAASEDIPPLLMEQLKEGGIMIIPIARSEVNQWLVRVKKTWTGIEMTELCGVRFVPLVEGIADD